MAEEVLRFDPVTDTKGATYTARVCGGVADDGLWEGWIEFEPADGGPALRTPRETEQPNRVDLEYWATGLTMVYLEGALGRARSARPAAGAASAPPSAPVAPRAEPRAATPHALVDPFAVYAQGEEVLRRALGALDEAHLRDVVRAHTLAPAEPAGIGGLGRAALVDLIIGAVRRRAGLG